MPIIIDYIQKINIRKNNNKESIICYEILQNIQLNCGNKIYINCYCFVKKCHYKYENQKYVKMMMIIIIIMKQVLIEKDFFMKFNYLIL